MGIENLLSGLLGKKGGKVPPHFTESINLASFSTVNDGKTLYAGQFNDVAVLKVPAQQVRKFGAGGLINGVDVRAIFFISLFDGSATPVQIEGVFKLSNRDANLRNDIPFIQPRTESLRGSKTDRNNAYLLGEAGLGSKQDSYLVMSIKPDTQLVLSQANSSVLVPMTVYAL